MVSIYSVFHNWDLEKISLIKIYKNVYCDLISDYYNQANIIKMLIKISKTGAFEWGKDASFKS